MNILEVQLAVVKKLRALYPEYKSVYSIKTVLL